MKKRHPAPGPPPRATHDADPARVTPLRPAHLDHPPLASLLRLRADTAMPLYQQLEEQLTSLIESGTVPSGAVLPAERQLAESLDVSRITIQRAYAALRQRHLVTAQGRKGFLVRPSPNPVRPGMDRLKGFTEEMRELGRIPSSRLLEREIVQDRSITSIFGLPSTAPLLKLTRIRYGDEVPMSREVAWYNLKAVPALEHGDLSGSVYAFLAEVGGARLVSCEQTVEATMPTQEECGIFSFDEPIPCLLIKRHSFTQDTVMIEYVEGLFRGDVYRYRLKLEA